MYSKTDYCEGRIVDRAKDIPDAGCTINFVYGRTSDAGSNRGFNQYVDRQGSTVVSLTLAMASAVGNDLMSFSTSSSFGCCKDS